jgi:hypothetical protein
MVPICPATARSVRENEWHDVGSHVAGNKITHGSISSNDGAPCQELIRGEEKAWFYLAGRAFWPASGWPSSRRFCSTQVRRSDSSVDVCGRKT